MNKLISGENASKKKKVVKWNSECQEAFLKLTTLCSDTPVLAYADYIKPFKVHTDVSEEGLGAELYPVQEDGTERVIAYASHTLLKPESRYDAHKLEFLALRWAICNRFHEYLYGGEFGVYTDNYPLTYILTTARMDAMGQRLLILLIITLRFSTGVEKRMLMLLLCQGFLRIMREIQFP